MKEKDEILIFDEAEEENIPYKYSITSYGADYPVDSIVKRLGNDVILVPKFQRSYVWPQKMASRFIESLLLGLPVPGIFLSRESATGKLLVIDGQQRLKTLQTFYDGVFDGKEFVLKDVQQQFEGRSYKSLNQEDRLRLDDSIIHATIVQQDEPTNDESSIFHIFERLNTGGMQLRPQEIRACIYYGTFNKLLNKVNQHEGWRRVYGKASKRLRDQELILRFFALYFYIDHYERPMKEFLNKYMAANRSLCLHDEKILQTIFEKNIDLIEDTLGHKAFRPERAFNVAVFDAVMVGLARRLDQGQIQDQEKFKKEYYSLLGSTDFQTSTIKATSNVAVVKKRIQKATAAFGNIT